MGILDDAIRDHLELKRRHGASEAEVHQQEVEALGSRGRDEPDEDSEAAASADLVDDEAPLDVAADTADGNGVAAGAAEPETHATEAEPELEHEPAETPEGLEDVGPPRELDAADEPDLPSAPDLQEPEDAASAFEEPPPRGGDTPPRGFEAVEEHEDVHADPDPADEEPADEDVLEDTPDFLQETPEHDRLWFEQKPPRDFDFE